VVAATGIITGTPTTAGTTSVVLSATNSAGTGNAMLVITVAAAGVAPIITNNPLTATGIAGTAFVTYFITATGLPTSYSAVGLPFGLALDPLTGAINGTPLAAGTSSVALTATNTTGSGTATLTITIAPMPVAPIITTPAGALQGTVGTAFTPYSITATGAPFTFTATGLPAGLSIDTATGTISGTPTAAGTASATITATNAVGTGVAFLAFAIAPAPSSRIVNFSARALSGPGEQTLIVGFVVAGDGMNLLVRGIGPSLAAQGVTNFLADPMLTVFNPTGPNSTNDNWGIDSNGLPDDVLIAATAARVGAFALPLGSKDAALLLAVANGAHTTSMVRPNSTTGIALTELYDTTNGVGARLINVSARMNVSLGEGVLIAGFVISGNAPKTVLIRGVGPALSSMGVNAVLANPQIALYAGSTQIATNDDWGTGASTPAQIVAISAQVGAFALPLGSKDAALLVTLQPGIYSVLVSGVGNTTGIALVEIYDTQ